MKILNTSPDDDFLYEKMLNLLYQIKLVQGNTALNATLRRHSKIRRYLLEKQVFKLNDFEEKYFNPDGTLDLEYIELHKPKIILHKSN